MNADGMPSLWVQTVCVYSVRGLLGSDASDFSPSITQHRAAQKQRIRLAARKDRMGTRVSEIVPLNHDNRANAFRRSLIASHGISLPAAFSVKATRPRAGVQLLVPEQCGAKSSDFYEWR